MDIESRALEVFGVYDRGVPNRERIVLRANRPIELTRYALLLGVEGRDQSFIPLRDEFLWLGTQFIATPGWVFVYTGDGQGGVSQETFTKDPIYMLFWQKPSVILDDHRLIPTLVSFGDVEIGNNPPKSMSVLLEQGHDELQRLASEVLRLNKIDEEK